MTREGTWATLVRLGVVEGNFVKTRWTLHRANLSEADLNGAYLRDATLTASVLIKTNLIKANLSDACIDNANISGWVIKDVTCSHVREEKSGTQIMIEFEPLEFEEKYTRIEKITESIIRASHRNQRSVT